MVKRIGKEGLTEQEQVQGIQLRMVRVTSFFTGDYNISSYTTPKKGEKKQGRKKEKKKKIWSIDAMWRMGITSQMLRPQGSNHLLHLLEDLPRQVTVRGRG